MDKYNEVKIECNCGCSIVRIFELDEDYFVLDFLIDSFSTIQLSLWKVIKRRLKLAWYGLSGKEYRLHEIVLTTNQVKELIENLNKVI